MLVLGNRLLLVGSPMLLVYSLLASRSELTHLALALLGAAVMFTIVQWLGAARLRCPLCLGVPLAHNSCIKHRHARRLFGSYRMRVAASIMLEDSFRCPYCGEFTAIAVRNRPRRRSHR